MATQDSQQQDAAKGRPGLRKHFRKTELCTFYVQGRCMRGDVCEFAHGEEDLQPLPDFTKTSLCWKWLQGRCPHQKKACRFAHGPNDLRTKAPGGAIATAAPTAAGASRGAALAPAADRRAVGAAPGPAIRQEVAGNRGNKLASRLEHEEEMRSPFVVPRIRWAPPPNFEELASPSSVVGATTLLPGKDERFPMDPASFPPVLPPHQAPSSNPSGCEDLQLQAANIVAQQWGLHPQCLLLVAAIVDQAAAHSGAELDDFLRRAMPESYDD